MSQKNHPNKVRRDVLKAVGSGIALLPLISLTACSGDTPEPAAPADPPADPTPPAATTPPAPEPPPQAATPPAAEPDSSLPRLSEDDPAASALGYRHDASQVDTAAYPRKTAEMACSNCALWQGGDADWGGCSIFPGKQVAAAGWCNAWAPKG